jgi:hypothetical protein
LNQDAALAVKRMSRHWDAMTAGKLVGALILEEESRIVHDDLAGKPNEVKAYLGSVTR